MEQECSFTRLEAQETQRKNGGCVTGRWQCSYRFCLWAATAGLTLAVLLLLLNLRISELDDSAILSLQKSIANRAQLNAAEYDSENTGELGLIRVQYLPESLTPNNNLPPVKDLEPCLPLPMDDRKAEHGGWFGGNNIAKHVFDYITKVSGVPLVRPCRNDSDAASSSVEKSSNPTVFQRPLFVPSIIDILPEIGITVINDTFEGVPAMGTVNISIASVNQSENRNFTLFVAIVNNTELAAREKELPVLAPSSMGSSAIPFCAADGDKSTGKILRNMQSQQCIITNDDKKQLMTANCTSKNAVIFCLDPATQALRTSNGLCVIPELSSNPKRERKLISMPLRLGQCADGIASGLWTMAGWYGWQVYNNSTRLCWDVPPQRPAQVVQERCKLISDNEPPSQWFVWV